MWNMEWLKCRDYWYWIRGNQNEKWKMKNEKCVIIQDSKNSYTTSNSSKTLFFANIMMIPFQLFCIVSKCISS